MRYNKELDTLRRASGPKKVSSRTSIENDDIQKSADLLPSSHNTGAQTSIIHPKNKTSFPLQAYYLRPKHVLNKVNNTNTNQRKASDSINNSLSYSRSQGEHHHVKNEYVPSNHRINLADFNFGSQPSKMISLSHQKLEKSIDETDANKRRTLSVPRLRPIESNPEKVVPSDFIDSASSEMKAERLPINKIVEHSTRENNDSRPRYDDVQPKNENVGTNLSLSSDAHLRFEI